LVNSAAEYKQMTSEDSNRARFGPYEVDLHTHELWKFGMRLKLVGQPFEILSMLLSQPGELVTRDEMRDRLWPSDTFVDFNHGLNAAVNKLREALSDSADAPRYIETLPRRGYRFMAPVEWMAESAPAAVATAPVALEAQPPEYESAAEVTPVGDDESHPNRTSRYLVAAVAFAVLLAVGGLMLRKLRFEPTLSAHESVEHTRPLLSVPNTASPTFSPDGNSVAFFHEGPQGSGIYVTRVGSDQIQRLTTNEEDCCPVWSPDGRWIAFSRLSGQEHEIYVVSADGGSDQKHEAEQALGAQPAAFTKGGASTQRKLDTGGVVPRRGEMDWSPDGNALAFAGPSGIYLMSPEGTAAHRIIQTPPAAEDWGPQFSPDGRQLLFVRNRQVGEPDEIWVAPANGGEPTRLLSERGHITSPPQWSYDGRAAIFSSNRSGHASLFRVSLDAPDSVVAVSQAGTPSWDPAVSRRGYRLAYERLLRSLSIWQLDLSDSGDKRPYLAVSSTSDTDQGPGPQFSPDGKRLAYMSDRNGTMEIWIANRDGGNAFQLTAVGGAGTPRWSPDSQSVAFDVASINGEKIATMNLHGGAPQVLADGVCPSWSRDGKWIYFGADRDGVRQVWKVPAEGGTPVQVTRHGGHAALESLDGKYVYYSKTYTAEPEIWRVPVEGGDEVSMPLIHPGTWASWQVVAGGVLFVGPSLGHQAVLSFFDFAKNRTSSLAVLEKVPFWLGATTDGKTVAFDQPGREQSQAMLVENFR
jgi:Tol biopolymer transport system component/DNA-binding winged helix-turn-helix (wHTH) protein